MSDEAKAALIAFFTHPKDYLAGKSVEQKIAHLKKTSYRDYLRIDVGLDDEAIKYLDGSTLGLFAAGPDIVPALDALSSEFPGFEGLGLKDQIDTAFDEPYIYHYPDGNASIARLLVRSLVPAAASGHTMDDVVLADFNYEKLDVAGAATRLRLNSTVVCVANGHAKGASVDLGYVRSGTLHRIQARQCVLACYNMMIPHIMAELADTQRQALAACVKLPLVYVNVAIRNWRALSNLGVDEIYCPGAYFSNIKLDYPVSLGGYHNPRSPDEPILLHMEHMPLTPNQGLSNVDQFRLGRALLLATPFEEYEKQITAQLDHALGPGGFKSVRDIAAITVNRWPHGYSYYANSLFDPEISGLQPFEIARQRCGSVAIANSDAGWNAYTHEAIDQAWRAVNELKTA
jgi:spermidine dehydrogenase